MGARVRLAALIGLEVALVVGLHAVGRNPHLGIDLADLPAWLAATAPADAVAAVIRLVALGCAYWLLVTTTSYVLTQAAGYRGLRRSLRAVTHPVVRRAVERALVGMVATSTLSLAVAATAPPPAGATTAVAEAGADAFLPPGLHPPDADRTAADDADVAAEHEVRAGDHLWGIAVRTLHAARHGAVDDRDVARYWLALVATNADRLRSGDPHLIHPGERLVLPRIPRR